MGTPVGERIALESTPKRNVTVSAMAGYKALQLVFRRSGAADVGERRGETRVETGDLRNPIPAAIPIPNSKIRIPVMHTGVVARNIRMPLSCPRAL